VVLALLFRHSLLSLIPGLRELEYGKLKLKFDEGLAKAASEAAKIEAVPVGVPKRRQFQADDPDQLKLALDTPSALVLFCWIDIEHELSHAASRTGISMKLRATTPLVRDLENRELITPEVASIIMSLRNLRNEAAAHPGFAVESKQALEYAQLTKRLLAALKAIPIQ
jgi:hypothetical protein